MPTTANVLDFPGPIPTLESASTGILTVCRSGIQLPDPRPVTRWTSTFVSNVCAWQLADPSDSARALGALAMALADWVVSASDGLSLQLRVASTAGEISIAFVCTVTGSERAATVASAVARQQDLTLLLAACTSIRGQVLSDEGAQAVLVCKRMRHASVACPQGPGAAPLAAEALQPGLLRVVELMLADDSDTLVAISLRAVRDERPLRLMSDHVSASLADARGRALGASFTAHDGTRVHRLPEDIVGVVGSAAMLEREAAWLSRLTNNALELQVAVVGENPLPTPLLHAVGRSAVASQSLYWMDGGPGAASAILGGASTALDGVPVLPSASDTETTLSPITQVAARWVPAGLAATLLTLPVPGPDGLPGIPVDALVLRGVPNAIRANACLPGALLGEAPQRDDARRGRSVQVRLQPADLARHLYVCGKTGVGKSTLLRTLLVDLATSGEGVGLIDPHGDLADEVIAAVGARRKVVVFDPSQEDCLGLDPVRHDGTPEGIERAMEMLTQIVFSLYPGEMMGPMFDRHSRALLVPLLAAGENLSNLARLASDEKYRAPLVKRLSRQDPIQSDIRTFWEEEFAQWSTSTRGEMVTYTVSKYDALLRSSALRRVCDRTRPQLDLRAILDEGGVLVARLPESSLGPVTAWFLGMLLTSRLRDAAFSRGSIPPAQRRPFTLAMDEFQKFVGAGGYGYKQDTRTLGPMLDECRKFGVRLVLANQYVAQLDDRTRDSIFGNVSNMVCFRTGARDAEVVATQLGTTPDELRALPLFHGLAKVLVNGADVPVFTVRTIR